MATLRHHRPGRPANPHIVTPLNEGETEASPAVRVLGRIDGPLRYLAGEDDALLRILRGTVLVIVLAAVVAVIVGSW